jgi:hypothetical protein
MTRRRFTLLYRELEIGEVTELGADFPSFAGTWVPSSRRDHPRLRKHVQDYIEFSEQADALLEDGDVTPAWEAFTGQREQAFQDLIDSDEWALVDAQGVRHALLVPIFCGGREIVWRFKPQGDT